MAAGSHMGGRGQQISVDEAVPLHDLAWLDRYGPRQHWSLGHEGVELAALPAWIDVGRKLGGG